MSLSVSKDRVDALARAVAALQYQPAYFDDLQSFPPLDNDHIYANYAFFMVAIDHRAHRSTGERYQAEIDGTTYRGSDLMYILARRAQVQDQELFTAKRLTGVTEEEVDSIFSIPSGARIKAPGLRAMLLRDCATKLIEFYEGDVRLLLTRACGHLHASDKTGALDRLKAFRAYEDPVEKKSLLLLKILRRVGYFKIKDTKEMSVPVDNILVTIALRSGLVMVNGGPLWKKLAKAELLTDEETLSLRLATRQAFEQVAQAAALDADVLDDLLWTYGRELIYDSASAEKTHSVHTSLDFNIKDARLRKQFLLLMNGLDQNAPSGTSRFSEPSMPETWYF